MSLIDWLINPRERFRKLQMDNVERIIRKNLEAQFEESQRMAEIRESRRVPIEGPAREIVDKAIYIAKSPLANCDEEADRIPTWNLDIEGFVGWYGVFKDEDGLSGSSYRLQGILRSDKGVEPSGNPYGSTSISYLDRGVFLCDTEENNVFRYERGEWEENLESLYQKAKKSSY